jgi:hypothetical protein
MQRVGKLFWAVVPIATVLGFIAVEMRRVALMVTISNLDYFPLLDRAVRLGFSSWDGWIHKVHPVGYPWLIRLGLMLGWDAERVGQALSIAGGVLGLCGAYLLALSVFRDKRWAAIVQAYAAATNIYLYFASVEGNDMLAAGVQLLALGILAAASIRSDGPRLKAVFAGGAVAGLAYLVRYNGMLTGLACGVWLIALAIQQRRPAGWKAVGVYAAAFLLVSAVQWIPSWLATGTPLYNDQGQNVWFHVYGKSNFVIEFNQAPEGITLLQVFMLDPYRFVTHWWEAFQGFWVDPKLTLLDAPLKLFGQAGFVFLLLGPGPASVRLRSLLGLFALAHLGALSLMRLDRRFLIMLIPLLAIGALYLWAALLPPRWEQRRTVAISVMLGLAGLVWAAQSPIGFMAGRPGADSTVIETSNILHAAGIHSASEVLSTHMRLQDASALARDRFAQAYWLAPGKKSVGELTQAMQANGSWRFFVYDRDTGPIAYPALKNLLAPETRPAGLTPIYVQEKNEFVIYRLAEGNPCSSVDANFEGGIALTCYEANVSQDFPAGSGRRVGVYLTWQASAPVTRSLKIFVHLLGADGRPIAQDDSVPVLWLYPTTEWQPGENVIDFHQFAVDAVAPPGEYMLQVGLYDEETGVRVNRVDAAGNPIDDKVGLSKLMLQ